MSSRRFVITTSAAFGLVGLLSDNPFYFRLELRSLKACEESFGVKLWKWKPEILPSFIHSIRTAIAATVSVAVARMFGVSPLLRSLGWNPRRFGALSRVAGASSRIL